MFRWFSNNASVDVFRDDIGFLWLRLILCSLLVLITMDHRFSWSFSKEWTGKCDEQKPTVKRTSNAEGKKNALLNKLYFICGWCNSQLSTILMIENMCVLFILYMRGPLSAIFPSFSRKWRTVPWCKNKTNHRIMTILKVFSLLRPNIDRDYRETIRTFRKISFATITSTMSETLYFQYEGHCLR